MRPKGSPSGARTLLVVQCRGRLSFIPEKPWLFVGGARKQARFPLRGKWSESCLPEPAEVFTHPRLRRSDEVTLSPVAGICRTISDSALARMTEVSATVVAIGGTLPVVVDHSRPCHSTHRAGALVSLERSRGRHAGHVRWLALGVPPIIVLLNAAPGSRRAFGNSISAVGVGRNPRGVVSTAAHATPQTVTHLRPASNRFVSYVTRHLRVLCSTGACIRSVQIGRWIIMSTSSTIDPKDKCTARKPASQAARNDYRKSLVCINRRRGE
jgi:hypothetical protein